MHCIRSILVAFVCLFATTIVVAAGDSTSGRSGEAVFEANCANCHTGGIGGFFSGAPDIDDQDDWEDRAPKGLDELTVNTITGTGDMEVRGECLECTDEDIRAAVEHILEKVQ